MSYQRWYAYYFCFIIAFMIYPSTASANTAAYYYLKSSDNLDSVLTFSGQTSDYNQPIFTGELSEIYYTDTGLYSLLDNALNTIIATEIPYYEAYLYSQIGYNVDVAIADNGSKISGPINITIEPAGSNGENLFSISGMTASVSLTVTFSEYVGPQKITASCSATLVSQPPTKLSGNYDVDTGILSATETTVVSAYDTVCDSNLDGIVPGASAAMAWLGQQLPPLVEGALNQSQTYEWNVPQGVQGTFAGLGGAVKSGTYGSLDYGRSFNTRQLSRSIKEWGALIMFQAPLPDLDATIDLTGEDKEENITLFTISLPATGSSFMLNEDTYYTEIWECPGGGCSNEPP